MSIKFYVNGYDTNKSVSTLGKYIIVSVPEDSTKYIVPAVYIPGAVPYCVPGEIINLRFEALSPNFSLINILIGGTIACC